MQSLIPFAFFQGSTAVGANLLAKEEVLQFPRLKGITKSSVFVRLWMLGSRHGKASIRSVSYIIRQTHCLCQGLNCHSSPRQAEIFRICRYPARQRVFLTFLLCQATTCPFARMTSSTASTYFWQVSSSAASTITRRTGSVPDSRTRMRPVSPRASATSATFAWTSGSF